MDDERVQLLFKKEILTTVHAEKVLDLIQAAQKQCRDISSYIKQETCKEAKILACNTFKEKFVPKVIQYNALLNTHKNNIDFSLFKAHEETDTGLTILEATEIIGKVNLGYIDCAVTTTSLSPTSDTALSPMPAQDLMLPPTLAPTTVPTAIPTEFPTLSPTLTPTISPTLSPIIAPTSNPITLPITGLLIGVYCNGILEQTVSSLPSGIVCECGKEEQCTLNFV
jgi:hypothetical protein